MLENYLLLIWNLVLSVFFYFLVLFVCLYFVKLKFIAAAAAEMAYKNSRPPISNHIPKRIANIVQQSWNANPEVCESLHLIRIKKESGKRREIFLF